MNSILQALAALPPAPTKVPLVVPLAAHYRRSEEFERKRNDFYAQMNRYFGFEGWHKPALHAPPTVSAGRSGTKQDIRKSRKNLIMQDANAAPLEWLVFNDRLDDERMNKEIANVRADAGFKFRAEMAKAEIGGLGSPDWLATPSGGSGPRSLAGSKLEAMQSLGMMRTSLPKQVFPLLERVVWQDEWVWLTPKGQVDRKAVDLVLCALDYTAHHYRLLPWHEVQERWEAEPFHQHWTIPRQYPSS